MPTLKNRIENELDEIFEQESFLVERPSEDEDLITCEECIFGYEIFKYSPSTFAPANIVPISSTYALGPGDKLTIDLYGAKKDSEEVTVSRDGTIYLPFMGRINLAGLTFYEAQKAINLRAEKELIGTEVSISLRDLMSEYRGMSIKSSKLSASLSKIVIIILYPVYKITL